MANNTLPVTGAILAGGRGRRMHGEDKGLVLLNGQPLYHHVLHTLQPQVSSVVINANRNFDRYAQSGLLVLPDLTPDFYGPLGGMLAVLTRIQTGWVAFSPCDTPFLPDNWVSSLWLQKMDAQAVWLKSAERDHPTLALLNCSLIPQLQAYLTRGERRLMAFLSSAGGHAVLVGNDEKCFANMNTPEDILHL